MMPAMIRLFIKRLFGVLGLGTGSLLAIWFTCHWIWPAGGFDTPYDGVRQLLIPTVLLAQGWEWLRQ